MKKKISSKKIVAIALAIIMLVVSLPLTMFSALTTGTYDPAPYWGADGDEYGAVNTNFVATHNSNGSVDIWFPNANARQTYDGSGMKSIVKYVVVFTKLNEDGTRTQLYSDALTVDEVADGSATADYPNHIYYPAGSQIISNLNDTQATYDVGIYAVDSDGWISDKIHTLLTDVVYYDIQDNFAPVETWVAREMLKFESAGSAQINETAQSSTGNGNAADYLQYGQTQGINVDGKMVDTGADGTAASRFWINSAYSGTSFSYDTTWSRQHYNFTGAEEVWFYVNFSDVQFGKMAFNLRANEKEGTTWRDGNCDTKSQYGVLFSTKAINGVNTGRKDGIYIQNADGLWEETYMTDGYVTNIGGYEGYIRIPIEYFVLQENQYITADNAREKEWYRKNDSWLGAYTLVEELEAYRDTHMFKTTNGKDYSITLDGTALQRETDTITVVKNNETENISVYKFLVNEAGTPITDAYILYMRYEKATTKTSALQAGDTSTRQLGYTFAFDVSDLSSSGMNYGSMQTSDFINYTVSSSDLTLAISDLVSAGFEVSGWTADSVKKSFYIDDVLFCQNASGNTEADYNADGMVLSTATNKFPDEGGNFAGDLGYRVGNYYDRTIEVPKTIANYIDKYVGEVPSLNDIGALEMIDDMIEKYIDCFPGCTTVAQAIIYLNGQGYTEAYSKYMASKKFLDSYVNLGDSARNYNAVVAFESRVEALPTVEFADYDDKNLKTELAQLMALYKSFNLSHFEILGVDAEAKFVEIYDIVMGEEVKTGYSIGAYPYIPFNDFETNYTEGQTALKYYDDYPANDSEDTKNTDVNNTKNFVSYVANAKLVSATSGGNDGGGIVNQAGVLGGSMGWSVNGFLPYNNQLVGRCGGKDFFGRMTASITGKGFNNSQSATMHLKGEVKVTSTDGELNGTDSAIGTVSSTYNGANAGSWSALPGLDITALKQTATNADGNMPNSFVMYVDFSDVNDLAMNVLLVLRTADGEDYQAYYCGGSINVEGYATVYKLSDKGEWEEAFVGPSNIDNWAYANSNDDRGICSIQATDSNGLQGYKGFIAIPFEYFRVNYTSGVGEYSMPLDEYLEDGVLVKQVKVSVWDYTGENVGKDFSFDAMGFVYDPANATDPNAVATELVNDNSAITKVQNMDEYFGVKTNDSNEFEQAVAQLDPYEGKDKFIEDYNNAVAKYNALSPYQKTLEEVDYCYNTLLLTKFASLVADYDTAIANEPWVAKYATAAELMTDINALDSKITSFDRANTKLPNPYNMATGAIEYDNIMTSEQALAVKEMYEKGYMRLSGTEIATLTDEEKTSLENAYAAARRILLVDEYLADVTVFKNLIVQIYEESTREEELGERFVSYNNADLITTIESYEDMSVFAKQIFSDTTTAENAAYANMYKAVEGIYDNSRVNATSFDGNITGGIITFVERMTACATDVASKISSKTVLDTATLDEIEYCLGQTESFIQRYARVEEINIAYHELLKLLPVADIASINTDDTALTTIYLDNDTATEYTAEIDLSYIATRRDKGILLYAKSDLEWTQTTGVTHTAFDYFNFNDTVGAEGGTCVQVGGAYFNGNSSTIEDYTYKVSVDTTKASQVPTGNVYQGKITFYAVDYDVMTTKLAEGATADEVLADANNIVSSVEVPIVFNSTNGTDPVSYTVTIPADIQVDWDDTAPQDVSYEVEANIGSGKLEVSVSNDGADVLTNTQTGETYELAYTPNNFGATEFTGTVTAGTKPANAPNIEVTGWDNAPVGEYKTTLTYTVTYSSS